MTHEDALRIIALLEDIRLALRILLFFTGVSAGFFVAKAFIDLKK